MAPDNEPRRLSEKGVFEGRVLMAKNPKFGFVAGVVMILACFSGADVPSESAKGQEKPEATSTPPKWAMSEDDLKNCIREFQDAGRNSREGPGAEAGKSTKPRFERVTRAFDLGLGPIWNARTDRSVFSVAEEPRMVVSVFYRDQEPKEHRGPPLLTRAESEAFKKQSVRISEEEATSTARTFVVDHWGPQVLDGLGNPMVCLGQETAGWIYSIWWSNDRAAPVVFGKRAVRIEINPATGEVFHAEMMLFSAPSHAEIDADAFRKTLEKEFAGLNGIEVVSLLLILERKEDGEDRAIWHGSFTFECDEELLRINPYACHGVGDLEIDANTGEILIKSAE